MNRAQAHSFMVESNRIEGIHRAPTEQEIDATLEFVAAEVVTIEHLKALVAVYQPNAELRDRIHLNVRVGSHIAPRGGGGIVTALVQILMEAAVYNDAYATHHEYETLHPFTDGNGRSGRALWLWQVLRAGNDFPNIGFLHLWYYQSLHAGRHVEQRTVGSAPNERAD